MPLINNVVTLVGNITRDPELRYTPAGTAVADFGIAHNTRRKNVNGEWEDGETSFFDVTCWEQLAENASESLTKGTKVIVVGELRQESWNDKESGDKRSKVKVIAATVGPALDWATAMVERNERTGNASPRSDSPSGRSQGSVRRPQPVPEFSEEPF
jgi:single-strand DNA-binding protein